MDLTFIAMISRSVFHTDGVFCSITLSLDTVPGEPPLLSDKFCQKLSNTRHKISRSIAKEITKINNKQNEQ